MAVDFPILRACVTGGIRLRPSFLVIGAAKSGTTSLFGALKRHPDVCLPRIKEINYFSDLYGRGPGWYRRQFPLRWKAAHARAITGDASPAYLGVPESPARIHAYFGDQVRLVALLRNPVDRAWSHYRHRRRIDAEPLGFEQAIEREMERGADAGPSERRRKGIAGWDWYLGGGNYARLLGRYLAYYPLSALHVMFYEELTADPAVELDRLSEFLGITPGKLRRLPLLNQGESEALSPELRARLDTHFAPHNAELARLLGRTPPW